jgi:predicted ATPase
VLKTLRFKETWRCFKAGDTFEFRPGVNLLVGDQGCGKSSILQAIAASCKHKKYTYDRGLSKKIEVVGTPCTAGGFDFEKDNRRTLSYFGDDIQFQLAAMFHSHGQSNMAMLENLSTAAGTMIFLDEPDMALSIRSIKRLADIFLALAANGCQVIAAVHHPFLIWAFPEVYSLDTRQWVGSRKFVNSQLLPLDKPTK